MENEQFEVLTSTGKDVPPVVLSCVFLTRPFLPYVGMFGTKYLLLKHIFFVSETVTKILVAI
jgi:hypothetical protein